MPKAHPVSSILKSFVARRSGLRRLCLVQVTVARPEPVAQKEDETCVSVTVPCRNEVGNIQAAIERIPDIGEYSEIIFCDDKWADGTADAVRRMQTLYPHRDIRLLNGPSIRLLGTTGIGKKLPGMRASAESLP